MQAALPTGSNSSWGATCNTFASTGHWWAASSGVCYTWFRRLYAEGENLIASCCARGQEGRYMSHDPVPAHPGRREVIKAGVAAGVSALMPWQSARADLREVARNRTMILVWSGSREGRWVDWDLWNPYSIGSNHQNGPNLIYEPLAYYSAFGDKTYMWLAESYQFSADFKRLTIKTQSGISWSDGQPFSAEDVAYTLNTLRDLGPKVRWGVDPQQKIFDRRSSWWAADRKLAPLPAVERNIWLPFAGEQQAAQALITNQLDAGTGMQPATFPTVFRQNPKVITHTG